MLGFIWADGWVRKTKYHREVRIECVREDIEHIKPYFDEVFNWKVYYRNRINRRPQARLNLVDKEFVDFLLESGYSTKRDAMKALWIIPKRLRSLWFRGLIDGDGCWYYNSKLYKRQFSLTSNKDQDWSFFERLSAELGFNYRMYRRYHSSVVEISNKKDIEILGNYIYDTFPEDKIGLDRKYNKWVEIVNSYVRK